MVTPIQARSRIKTAQNLRSVLAPHTVAPGLKTRRSSQLWSTEKVLALDLRVFSVSYDRILLHSVVRGGGDALERAVYKKCRFLTLPSVQLARSEFLAGLPAA